MLPRKHSRTYKRPHSAKENPKRVIVVGKIYAKWCHYCQQLAPHWDRMDQIIQNIHDPHKQYVVVSIRDTHKDVEIAKINATYLANSDQKLEIPDGYPTLFKIDNGKLSYYKGNHLGMLRWYTGSSHKTQSNRDGNNPARAFSMNDGMGAFGGDKRKGVSRKGTRKGTRKGVTRKGVTRKGGLFSFLWK